MLIKYSNKELDLCARLMRAEAQAVAELQDQAYEK